MSALVGTRRLPVAEPVDHRRFSAGRTPRSVGNRPSSLWAPTPTWIESLLFLALMTGPPKFSGDREVTASLAGQIDGMVIIQIAVWASGALWVFARLFSSTVKRGVIPVLNPVLITAWFLIAALSISLPQAPGVLLTGFTLGQYAVMLSFAWVFVHRFGAEAYLRHLFIGVSVLAVVIAAAALVSPELVFINTRLRGDKIADTGVVAALGLVFCITNVPKLSSRTSWGMLLLFGVLLALSQTRVAYVAVLVSLAIGYMFGKGLRVRKLVPLLAMLTFGLLLLEALSSVTNYMIRETRSLETMSDRIPLWQFLTTVVMRDAPWTGLGYYSASRVWAPEYNPALGNAHSSFFEILFGGGITAAALYLVLCALLLWYAGRLLNVARHQPQPEVIAAVGLLAVTLILGVTSLAVHVGPSGFTFWALPTILPTMWRQYRRAPRSRDQRLAFRRSALSAHAAVHRRSALS